MVMLVSRAVATEQALFPLSSSFQNWTTFSGDSHPFPLNDSTFRPTHEMSGSVHTYAPAPYGRPSMKAHYPKGSYRPDADPRGGMSFYAPGPASVNLSTATHATFAYSVWFPAGFNFVMGGKLPGFYGGENDTVAMTCSGGSRNAACFSARLMWRANGTGEMYTYLPPANETGFSANGKLCSLPDSDCNDTFGASIGRGNYTWTPGQWTTVAERVKLNDVGKANGELELFLDGTSVISVNGLILRGTNQGRIRGLQMQTFFGGHTPDWATPIDQDVYFSDFSVAILSTQAASKSNAHPKLTKWTIYLSMSCWVAFSVISMF